MTINGFTTKGKERELQTRKEQAKGRKALTTAKVARTKAEQKNGRNAAKLSAREQEKTLKDYYAKEKRLKELEKEDAARPRGLRAIDLRPDPLSVDPNVVLPKAVQAVVDVANAHYEPHAKFTFAFEVLNLDPTKRHDDPSTWNTLQRIADGVSEAIKVILAQHSLRPLANGQVVIETVVVQPKQKEVTNGE